MSNEARSSYDASSMTIGLDKELERLLIFDIDDDLTIFDPQGSPEIQAIDKRLSTAFREEQASKGGNRLIGRRLLHTFKKAGFQSLDLEGIIVHSELTDVSVYPA